MVIADRMNRCLRVMLSTADGAVVRTLVGKAGSTGSRGGRPLDARLTDPRDLLCLADGALVWTDGHAVRRLGPGKAGVVETLAGSIEEPGRADGVGGAA